MTSKCVPAKAFTHFFLFSVGGDALILHDALDDDVPGQQTHFRSLVHVVREVSIVTVTESPCHRAPMRQKEFFLI